MRGLPWGSRMHLHAVGSTVQRRGRVGASEVASETPSGRSDNSTLSHSHGGPARQGGGLRHSPGARGRPRLQSQVLPSVRLALGISDIILADLFYRMGDRPEGGASRPNPMRNQNASSYNTFIHTHFGIWLLGSKFMLPILGARPDAQ